MAKVIDVSDDNGSNYYTIPGANGDLSQEAGVLNDTIFGQTYQSQQSGVIKWSVAAGATYKGYAGYVAEIKKHGSSTSMTGEAMSLVSGKTYKITNAAKNCWNRAGTFVVYDNAVDHTADVLSIDYLWGRVTFKAAYTPTTPITVDGAYFPLTALGQGQSFNLTMNAAEIRTTTFALVQANGGYHTHDPGLRTATLDITGVYALASGFKSALASRSEWVVEVNPDGADKSSARGFFKILKYGQKGDVGALEEDTVSFTLQVPVDELLANPFSWIHASDTIMPTALQKVLTAWQNETKLDLRYLPDGTNGDKGDVIVTECSLSSGLEAMNEFKLSFTGDGVLSAHP